MAKMKKPTHQPSLPFPPAADELRQEGSWLWIPLRKEWRDVTNKPEEIVRQKFIRALVEHYGYSLEQMDQERRTQHGHKSPRAVRTEAATLHQSAWTAFESALFTAGEAAA